MRVIRHRWGFRLGGKRFELPFTGPAHVEFVDAGEQVLFDTHAYNESIRAYWGYDTKGRLKNLTVLGEPGVMLLARFMVAQRSARGRGPAL